MKILISNAIWGETYCSTFARFSLASLLSRQNIPELAKNATLTCHIVTRRVDQQRLLREPALLELQRYCELEWELMEDYGVYQPPEGAGGEKYPFLSALQNIAIRRSIDHDAIVFNYADFIWADGSLTRAVAMLSKEGDPIDAVFSFCLPVDRDMATPLLEQHRQSASSQVIQLAPRDAAKIAIACIHREAKIRFWEESPRFTNLPSYIIWRVDDQGILIRAYHQSILVMRVRGADLQYLQGIVRGSLDASFGAQLAKSTSLAFVTESDQILVFSLYHTIVDSRVPEGVTRETSLQHLLTRDVTPEQRSFAERPIYVRLCDGGEENWNRVAEASWSTIRQAQGDARFDQSAYNKNYQTHGVIPKIAKLNLPNRLIRSVLWRFFNKTATGLTIRECANRTRRAAARARHVWSVLRQPKLLRPRIENRLARTSAWQRSQRIWRVLKDPRLLRSAVNRRLARWWPGRVSTIPATNSVENYLFEGNVDAVEAAFAAQAHALTVTPNVSIEPIVHARYMASMFVEGLTTRVEDTSRLATALRTAEELLRRAVDEAPIWAEPVRALGRNLWFQGRFDEAIRTFSAAEELRDEMARMAGWSINSCVFLPRNCAESIGLMGHIDAFVKYKILTSDERPYYLIAPAHHIINSVFLDYWRQYITVVSEPEEIAKLAPLEAVYAVNWNWVMPKLGEAGYLHVHEGIAAVQRAWQRAGRLPLLTLCQGHANSLSRVRAKWGMNEQDQFVCLHIRSTGFYGGSREKAQTFRNTAIDSYYPLIRDLTDRGFWVIRMGDPSMPPLDRAQCGASGRTIDYALSSDKSAELDVALCSKCELFVSSPSGLHTVAHAFGRPTCDVNYPIYSGFPWNIDEIFVPQLYFSRLKDRALTLPEILGADLVHRDHQFLLEQAGIVLVPNEPDEILETVREALSPSTYHVKDTVLADRVCAAFDDLNRQHNVSISGRLGRYFAAKYAQQLLPDRIDLHESTLAQAASTTPRRKLDILIPSFNRPAQLHHILQTGLALQNPDITFVVIDDGSTAVERIPGLGPCTAETVCRSFPSGVIYVRNATNMGLAASLARYYAELCRADYTMLVNDKDEFIDGRPIASALAKLDADPNISIVLMPLRQVDRVEDDRPLLFRYSRMSGPDFIAQYVQDSTLQHCGMYGVIRVSAIKRAAVPRSLNLRDHGLEDAFGIDIDFLLNCATTGDVDFESLPHVRRSVVGGMTERYPLTFAYSYYQYAKRVMLELEGRGLVSAATRRRYLSFWHLLIARGLVVAYRHVHGTELEEGTKRIQPHLPMPILLYLPVECLRLRVAPRLETIGRFVAGARLLLADWVEKRQGGPRPS